ncbi:hypothetical protein EG327_003391 [Venturia inaequalis]|uniref:Uncharacterized protein n=1 Tax=Venturia inaequalis TaxID=5025 RepID=A0A8H3ZCJ7_VENIN|nr:hypothetical protein EG327_003391 [Venturia inaequalis]
MILCGRGERERLTSRISVERTDRCERRHAAAYETALAEEVEEEDEEDEACDGAEDDSCYGAWGGAIDFVGGGYYGDVV